jgi:hypothetical protein
MLAVRGSICMNMQVNHREILPKTFRKSIINCLQPKKIHRIHGFRDWRAQGKMKESN